MQQSSWFSYFLTGILALLFLAGCQDTPPSIQFNTSEGQVIDYQETNNVSISGKVVAGTNSVIGLQAVSDTSANKIADIPIGEDGSFNYDFTLTDPDTNKFSTCRFKVIDSKRISAQERITFIGGTAANQGAPAQYDAVEQALSVLVNEQFVNTFSVAIQNVVNTRMQDILDDSGLFPLEMDLVEEGLLQIAATLNEVDISDVSMGHIGFEDGQEIRTTNIEGVSKAFHIGNLHIAGNFQLAIHIPIPWPLPDIHVDFPSTTFDINVNDVELDEMQMWAFYKPATNDVVVRFDVDDLTPEFWNQLNIDVILNDLDLASIPLIGPFLDAIWDALINFFIELFGNIFILLFDTLAIPIVDVDNLAMTIDTSESGIELAGIPIDISLDVAAWFPLATGPGSELPVYLTNAGCGPDCGELYVELGFAASATPFENQPNPLDYYYSTPDDMLPNHVDDGALAFDTDIGEYQNLTVALNDDTINMGGWALLQTGLLEGMDISPVFNSMASQLFSGMGGATVNVTLRTPPIADFSGELTEYIPGSDGATYCKAGKFIVKDMVINIDNLLYSQLIDTVRVSVDVGVAIELKIDEQGKRVEVFMGPGSSINIAYLYVNNKNTVLLTSITNNIVTWVMNNVVLPGLIKIEVPAVTFYDLDIQPYVYATQVGGDNNMIVRLGVSAMEEVPVP